MTPQAASEAAGPDDLPGAPAWLEDARLAEESLAAAYDAAPPACLAALKTGLALAHSHFGDPPPLAREEWLKKGRGFRGFCQARPLRWALVLFDDSFSAAARLCAAAAAPVFAGVETILAVCLEGEPCFQALTALELCGVEDIFLLQQADLERLFRDLGPSGSAVFLGPKAGEAEPLARARGLMTYKDRGEPALSLLSPDEFPVRTLEFCQGEAARRLNSDACPDAVYAGAERARQLAFSQKAPRLILGPGCEGFWLHPGLSPAFFRPGSSAFLLAPREL